MKYLYTEIARILGIDRQHNLIIIGAGNLGQAIANYTNFEKRGFMIKGMFDINPRLIGLVVRGVEIRGIDDLEQSVKAIQDLTISVHALAQDMRQMLTELKDQGSRLERFDGRLEALEQQIADCQAQQAACGSDYIQLQKLQEQQSALEATLEEKTERWVYLNELKEKIDAQETQ